MTEQDIQALLHELDQIRSHVLIFEINLTEILKGARAKTKAHLLVFQESFPKLRHIVEFAEQVVPTIYRMIRIWPEKVGSIPKATSNLKQVTEATEMATTEIMDVVDGVTIKIEKLKGRLQDQLQAPPGNGNETIEEVMEGLEDINDSLFQILNALQFQDITTQQIEATKAILAELHDDIQALFEGFLGVRVDTHVEYRPGTFDEKARYDQEEAKRRQEAIDRVFEENEAITSLQETAPTEV
ncbi:MAG TPA: hypothetical protein EYP17_08205 [Candidatus Latescibacteria bacterium]|nr:hypothetical protein [Candidatus Latescibacterota bacterium]